jgi:2'-5' RNA ligase
MRLFVALPIPAYVKEQLADLNQPIDGARWQEPSQIHLTLKFLGETNSDRTQDLIIHLQNIVLSAFSISIKGFGYFPKGKHPKVLWAGVSKNKALVKLQSKVEKTCVELGFKAENRSFKPHITIARLKGTPKRDIVTFINQHKQFRVLDIPIKEFVLYESLLDSKGAKHSRVKTFPLGERSD